MVHRKPRVRLLVPAEERKLGHPAEGVLRGIERARLPRRGPAERRERGGRDRRPIRDRQEKIAVADLRRLENPLEGRGPERLLRGRGGFASRTLRPDQTRGAVRLCELAPVVELLAGHGRAGRHA